MDDFDFGGYDIWGDTSDFDLGFGGGGSSLDSSFLNSFSAPTSSFDTSWLDSYVQPQVSNTYSQGGLGVPQGFGQQTGGLSLQQPGPAPQGQPQQQGFWNQMLQPQTLLGLGGALSGLIGTIAGGGEVATQGPRPTTAQKANMEQGNLLAQQASRGQMPLQQQQASLLQAIMGGQGLAQPYAQAVEQAFQPQLGDLYTQAAQMGRKRGFHDAPATSPPGGAILGPGLADLQGQMAQAKLGLMTQLPQLYNQPIATQGGFAQNYLGAAQRAPMAQTTTQPLAPQIGQAVGQGMLGIGNIFAQADQQQQQSKQMQSLLDAINKSNSGYSGLSYLKY